MDILAIDERWIKKIRYEQMQGRPNVKLKIQGIEMECLLNTGARINVMSYNKFQQLRCANDGHLEVKGKAEIEVVINQVGKMVTFTIVGHVIPEVIGGIEIQRQFGIELQWMLRVY